MIRLLTVSTLIFSLSVPFVIVAAGPTFYRYTDEQGRLHLDQTIPPQLAKNGYKIVDIKGNIIKEVPAAKTPEQLKAELELNEKAKLAALAVKKSLAQDQILLQSYSDEEDIVFARDSKLEAIQGSINLANQKIGQLRENLVALELRAGDMERAGKVVDKTTLDSIQEVEGYIAEHQGFIDGRQKQMVVIRSQMDRQLQRYRQLRQGMLTIPAVSEQSNTGSGS